MKRSQIAGVDPPPPTMTRAPAPGTTGRAADESPGAASLLPVRSAEGAVAHAGSARSDAAARMASGRTLGDTAESSWSAAGREGEGICGAAGRAARPAPVGGRWSVVDGYTQLRSTARR